MNTIVQSIDPFKRNVTLQSGEILQADVIVGADGSLGLARREIDESPEEQPPAKLKMFRCFLPIGVLTVAYFSICSATVSRELIKKDPELSYIYERNSVSSDIYPE
jgi:hypothetical protein